MKLRIDLHVHTNHSTDSRVSIEDAVLRCEETGLDGFAVTDHDTLGGLSEAMAQESRVVIIPGVEISARGAHILALDISEPIPAGLSIAETVDRIHGQGAVAVIAHPYSVLRTWVDSREIEGAKFNAVEVANAYQFPYGWMLKKNAAMAERLGLPQTGGSDAHIPEAVGCAYTVVEADSREVEDILNSIRKGRTEARGRGISLYERLKKHL
ncbi:MAG: CehA/McbA family metallohydrolase [Candidatus Bathyarchaeota archaeon]|nr:CehA/McbA family metallohydrolase [Candidatus Bathyarchaeota archaeon]